jgi:hypothetical protein
MQCSTAPVFLYYTTDRARRHQRLKVTEESITPTRSDQTNEADQPGSLFYPQFDSIFWSIASTECGEIPSSINPGISGDDTVSICISST